MSHGILKNKQTDGRYRHGMTHSSEYKIWRAMKTRCLCPSDTNYPKYGARGITVCAEWLESFQAFYRDMGPRPAGMTLERKKNEMGYCPENCCWATPKQQARNQCKNVRLTYRGKTQVATAWAEQLGMRPGTLLNRIHLGWSVKKALETPVGAAEHAGLRLTCNGQSLPVLAWATKLGCDVNVIYRRLKRGWIVERALTTPSLRQAKCTAAKTVIS